MARASAGLDSYSWGSALGSETMLRTWTWRPPSWVARLPQVFSAATTVIGPAAAAAGLRPAPPATPPATKRAAVAPTNVALHPRIARSPRPAALNENRYH